MLDQHPQQELGFWGLCGPSSTGRAASKCFLTLEVPMGSPSMQPPGSLCQHGAQHHRPGLGVGEASAVPTGDRRGLFTQEGVWRCEKGPACPSSHYLSLGCAKGLRRASLGSYQLQTFICLRAARPPSGGLLPTPSPAAAPSPAWPAGEPLTVVVGSTSRRCGVTAAAPSHFVTTWEQ